MARNKYPTLKKPKTIRSKSRYFRRLITRGLKYSGLLLLSVGVAYGGQRAYSYISRSPYFEVTGIRIKGNRLLNHSQICQLANLHYQQNLFEVDSADVRAGLVAHPYIKQAWVSKRLPGNIQIRVQERSMFAVVNSASLYVVDEEGVVLKELTGASLPYLPQISGVPKGELQLGKRCTSATLAQGLEILKRLKEVQLLDNVSEIDLQDANCPLFYTLRERIEVRLGKGRFKRKLSYMKTVWQNLNARIREVKSMDLRYQDMVVVRFKQPNNPI